MQFNESAQGRSLVENTRPIPTPGLDEALIRVHTAGVTQTEVHWYPTTHTKTGQARAYAIPGHEFSGVIAGLGENAAGFQIGQEVYGLNDWFAEGATAEYCVAQVSGIAPKPLSLTHEEAASVPIGALTAWQGLIERARIMPGERVLIHGGGGAVGIFVIQLAARAGAHVVTTVSAQDAEFVRKLGAKQVIDYRSERFEEIAGEVDVVFDGVGGETLQRSWSVLKETGRLVTIVSDNQTADERGKAAFFIVEPNRQQLIEIARLFDLGELKTRVGEVLPLSQASVAYFGASERRRSPGKTVITNPVVGEP